MSTRIAFIAVLVAAPLAPFGAAGPRAQPRELPATVVTVSGQAEIHQRGAPAWMAAALRVELGPGDSARTLDGGRLTLRTTSGQAVRVGPRSTIFVVGDAAIGGDQPTRVRMDSGRLWVAVTPGTPAASRIQVLTPAVTVTVHGSGVGIVVNRDGSVLVRVSHGLAVCTGPGSERQWERMLTDRQQVLISPAGAPAAAGRLAQDKAEASWMRWNEEQDHAGGYGGPAPKR